jgi:transcriptional regulator with XRE-family HTH domain
MTRYAMPARQRLVGWHLRDYRESAGYDLAEAARILECNRSKISRIETGQRGIHPKELRELLAEYGARPAVVEALVALARPASGPAALYTEEYDVHQRQLRGNLPQAFVYATMLECAVTLSRDVPRAFDS